VRENAVFLGAKLKLQLGDLLRSILVINPSDRLTPSEALNHSFFR